MARRGDALAGEATAWAEEATWVEERREEGGAAVATVGGGAARRGRTTGGVRTGDAEGGIVAAAPGRSACGPSQS